jgi:hypothetical protein
LAPDVLGCRCGPLVPRDPPSLDMPSLNMPSLDMPSLDMPAPACPPPRVTIRCDDRHAIRIVAAGPVAARQSRPLPHQPSRPGPDPGPVAVPHHAADCAAPAAIPPQGRDDTGTGHVCWDQYPAGALTGALPILAPQGRNLARFDHPARLRCPCLVNGTFPDRLKAWRSCNTCFQTAPIRRVARSFRLIGGEGRVCCGHAKEVNSSALFW